MDLRDFAEECIDKFMTVKGEDTPPFRSIGAVAKKAKLEVKINGKLPSACKRGDDEEFDDIVVSTPLGTVTFWWTDEGFMRIVKLSAKKAPKTNNKDEE